ncbi:hypothetical protein ACO0LL_07195 [Undibacterium sp. TC4M20W]|uniref:hypothetical protein n=1 Tax=unclassified Undibacterium TaxID=2630295 RepID=UPI003BF3BA86
MREIVKNMMCRLLIVSVAIMPAMVRADSVSTVGAVGSVDSSIAILDANTQKNMRATNALGTSETNARSQKNCGNQFDTAINNSAKNVATAAAPGDPVKRFNDSINSCLENIQLISVAFNLPTSFSFTAAFEAILNQLIDKLINEIIMKICAAATGAWNSAVNNAVNTVNSGINQSGVNTFGNFVNVGTAPANPPPAYSPAPPPAAPAQSQSTIPGL